MSRLLLMYSNDPPTPAHVERLRIAATGWSVTVADSEAAAMNAAYDTRIILGHRYLRQVLPHAPQLGWVQSTAAGVEHLLTDEFAAAAPLLCRCPIFSDIVAWHAVSLAMAVMRRLPEAAAAQRERVWSASLTPLPPPRTAMVIGVGRIGQELARLLRGMGVRVLGVYRDTAPPRDCCDEAIGLDAWRACLPDADWCFLAIPESPQNDRFFDRAAIDALPPHAVLVNVGRGASLDQTALVERLREGRLGGAALDVTEPLPPAEDDPAWTAPRLLITPKIAVFTPHRQARLEAFIEEQVHRYIRGETPLHRVEYQRTRAARETQHAVR